MGGRWDEARGDVMAALPGWVTARVVVLVALGLAHLVAQRIDPGLEPLVHRRLHQGLLAWDGDWYLRIADRGYAALPDESLRFFPLYPMLGRALAPVFLGNAGVALLVLANLPALLLGALVHRLSLRETGDAALARRAAWLIALVPPFFVMVMGYGEPVSLCLSVAAFLALRRQRWEWAAAAGFLAGLARPVGVLLAIPAAIEAARGLRAAGAGERLRRVLPVVAPVVGAGTFLVWVWVRFDDALLPLRVQNRSYLRGGFANPLVTVFKSVGDVVGGDVGRNAIHLPWIVVIAALVVVAFRRWPASYGAFAAASLVLALSARNLGSFERYGFGAFPVVLALASITASEWSERMAIGVSVALMAGYATVAFLNLYVP
ncbi:MAG: hypothetical protein QOD63_2231 [Actinomycetota bacterium]|nr:hypothetical protein [Actinomycetota bacterium]